MFHGAEETDHAKNMLFSMEAVDADKLQKLSHHILDLALELGDNVNLPTDSPWCTLAGHSYDDHSCLSLNPDLVKQTV